VVDGTTRLGKSKAAQEKRSGARQNLLLCCAMRQHARNLHGSNHGGKDHEESALFVIGSPARHKWEHSIPVVYEFGKNLLPDRLVTPRQLGSHCRERATKLGMVAIFQAQIGLHNRLPSLPMARLRGSANQLVSDIAEGFLYRFAEQVFFALEVFVKAPWVSPVSRMTAATAAPVKPSARTRREASFTIFRWTSALCSGG
jgi:hypothetical protein